MNNNKILLLPHYSNKRRSAISLDALTFWSGPKDLDLCNQTLSRARALGLGTRLERDYDSSFKVCSRKRPRRLPKTLQHLDFWGYASSLIIVRGWVRSPAVRSWILNKLDHGPKTGTYPSITSERSVLCNHST